MENLKMPLRHKIISFGAIILALVALVLFLTPSDPLQDIAQAKEALTPQVEQNKQAVEELSTRLEKAKGEYDKTSEALKSLDEAERKLLTAQGVEVVAQGNFTPTKAGLDNFLAVNGAKMFKDSNMWREVGRQYGINSSLLVCIAQADTQLGNNLATQYNVGNVGNTDSGKRRSFNSPKEGVEAIAQTLNNQYLKDKQTIGSLSTGGGGQAPLYATSKENWNRNVIGCISTIEGVQIKEDWNFRL